MPGTAHWYCLSDHLNYCFVEPLKYGMDTVKLTCHPTTPCEAVYHIRAKVSTSNTGTLALRYTLDGDIGDLRVPIEATPRRADNLWQHTCFEAFIAAKDAVGYHEFNFAPSGEWTVYRFDAYRKGMTAIEAAQPIITMHRAAQHLVLEVVVDLKPFLGFKGHAELRLALSAVIEESNGRLSYWALAHPPGKPDFHHADGFTLALDQRGRLA